MKRILPCLCLFIALFSLSIWADDIPVFRLDQGENSIAISIMNSYFTSLTNVKVGVDRANLPSWLTVQESAVTIDIPKGKQSDTKLTITMTVADAPPVASAEVPLVIRDGAGNSWKFTVAVEAAPSIPLTTALHDNYPNPFNPSTTISYSLAESGHARIIVFNSLGQQVRTLADGPQSAGVHVVQWDGRNENGQNVSSGVYFYRLTAGRFMQTKRMMLVE